MHDPKGTPGPHPKHQVGERPTVGFAPRRFGNPMPTLAVVLLSRPGAGAEMQLSKSIFGEVLH